MKRVKAKGVSVVVCASVLDAPEFFDSEVTHDLEAFKTGCDVVVTNCWSDGSALFRSQIDNRTEEHGPHPRHMISSG